MALRLSHTMLALAVTVILDHGAARAVEPASEHTYELGPGEAPPAATLRVASMLVGAWTGTAFGQQFEEVWNAPSAGTMVGMYKQFAGDSVSFYELCLLTEESGTLVLKVKHFHADFSAWEDKAETVDFPLVAVADDELHFAGLSFYRRSDDLLDAYILIGDRDGNVSEQHFVYRRR